MAYSLHIILGAVIFRVGSGVPFEALRLSLYDHRTFCFIDLLMHLFKELVRIQCVHPVQND